MKLQFEARPAKPGDIAVRFITQDRRGEIGIGISPEEFSGRPNSVIYLREKATLYVGVGQPKEVQAQTLRSAAGTATLFLKKIAQPRLALHLEEWPQFVGPVVEGLTLADYRFEQFATKRSTQLASVRILVLPGALKQAKREGADAFIVAQATNQARDIGNQPGNLLNPAILAAKASAIARQCGLKVTVLDEAKLRAGRFGGLLAVGLGSKNGPRLIVLEHRLGPKNQPPIALVGKAITFDSGGISIKPAANMENMIFDKCGGIAVLGAMAAIAKLGLKVNVIGLIASAENLPSASAYRPGDIINVFDGTSVEIVNTDAEGRIVLADAIGYARKRYQPSAIVDLATLTGACGVALGEQAAGLWSSDPNLQSRLLAASEPTGERLWPMPLYSEYSDQIKSPVAALKNSGGRLGGACTAAAFLKAFAGDIPWAHLDIAYTAHRDKDRSDLARGATGFGIRTLVELVQQKPQVPAPIRKRLLS